METTLSMTSSTFMPFPATIVEGNRITIPSEVIRTLKLSKGDLVEAVVWQVQDKEKE